MDGRPDLTHFSKKRGIYGPQLARVLVPSTQEIIAEELYEGNRLSPIDRDFNLPSVWRDAC